METVFPIKNKTNQITTSLLSINEFKYIGVAVV